VAGSSDSEHKNRQYARVNEVSEEDRRLIGPWAADCAERVPPLLEAKAPSDTRPREAIEGIRAFARGGKRTGQPHFLAWAAHAAARDVGDPAATAAARAAGYAAAPPYIPSLATPHQAKHALGPATYQARARDLAAGDDAGVGDQEIRWAIEHASPAVREVVRRIPVCGPGRSRLDALLYPLGAALRRRPARRAAAELARTPDRSPNPRQGQRLRGSAHRRPPAGAGCKAPARQAGTG